MRPPFMLESSHRRLYLTSMHVACPSCATTYDIPPDRLAGGKVVKCARCAESWVPVPLPPVVEIPPVEDEPPHAPPGEPPAPMAVTSIAPVAPTNRLLLAAWIVSILLPVAAIAALYIWRHDAMRLWPPIGRLFALVGLRL